MKGPRFANEKRGDIFFSFFLNKGTGVSNSRSTFWETGPYAIIKPSGSWQKGGNILKLEKSIIDNKNDHFYFKCDLLIYYTIMESKLKQKP